MSKHHKRTLLIDGNLSTPNVHVYLGWPILKKTLHDALRSQAKYKEVIYTHDSGMRILPTITTLHEVKNLKHERLVEVIQDLEGESDLILLDSSSGVGREALCAMQACDEVLIVTNPELGAVLDAQKTIQLAHELGKTILGVVLNKARKDKYELNTEEVEKLLDLPVIGVVPFDNAIRKSITKKQPVTHSYPKSRAAMEYEELASMLLGRKYLSRVSKNNTIKEYILRGLGFG
jgi:MinD-like ATPase involved in chromosome partitioning or flagellar assembly